MFWTIVTIISIGVAVFLAYLILHRFSVSPTITTMETSNYPTWKIPFPAVTLCNSNKVRKSVVLAISEKLSKLYKIDPVNTENYFKKIIALITRDDIEFLEIDRLVEQSVLSQINKTDATIEDIMYMVSQPCTELLVQCKWNGKKTNCSEMFHPSKAVDGHCCSFNYFVNLRNLTSYTDNILNTEYIGGTGRDDGLTVIMNTNSSDYFAAIYSYYGIKVIIHEADIFPETSTLDAIAQPGNILKMAINPYYVKSEENVKSLKLSQRLCLFPDEAKLLTLNLYDYQQCINECRVRIIYNYCKCIPFFYPLSLNSSILCNLTHAECMNKNSAVFSNLLPDNVSENSETLCTDCLPDCSQVSYTKTSTVTKLNKDHFTISSDLNSNHSKLRVLYQDILCIKYRREAMVTWDTIVASLGGIFGLCLGGSVLSIVELIFYFTIRLFRRIHDNKRKKQKTIPKYY
ncbi:pickpocket protein 28-like isoform X2 [Daktulosphaira vitifoliae]|nr:pickpocket protein 28-like isoform X2 [Daktulosphaira vitifoliae]